MFKALTEYEGLCGFRPISEIKDYLKNVPEFAAIVGDAASSLIQSSGTVNHPRQRFFILKITIAKIFSFPLTLCATYLRTLVVAFK